jgi:hypothetical protein
MRVQWVTVLVLSCLASVSRAVDVTVCGQHIAPGEIGVMQNDIDCTGSSERIAAIYLGDHATLSMNGHTITATDVDGVVSDVARRCVIQGPGTITGGVTAIRGAIKTRMIVTNVTLTNNLNAIDVALGRADLTDVTSSSTRSGVWAGNIRATRVSVNVDFAGDCILGGTLRGTDVTVSGCHTGVYMQRAVRVTRLDDRDNLTVGVLATRVRLVDSVVTGNIFIGSPLDILSPRRPVLLNTSCDASAQLIDDTVGPTWGVCAGD